MSSCTPGPVSSLSAESYDGALTDLPVPIPVWSEPRASFSAATQSYSLVHN